MTQNNFFQIKIRITLFIIMSLVFVFLLMNECSTKPKVYRVGIVSDGEPFDTIKDGFKKKMSELGYIEDKNIIYYYQEAPNNVALQEKYLKKFIADKVDLLFVFPTSAAIAAKKVASRTKIPVVFAYATLEGIDLVESIRKPGGNITGVRFPGPDMTLKRYEFLMELAPRTKRLWITYGVNMPAIPKALKLLRPATAAAGVKLVEVPVTSVQGIRVDLEARASAGDIGMDAILMMPEGFSQVPEGWGMISKFAAKYKIPIGGGAPIQVYTGAVFTYVPDNIEVGGLAASLADKIFKGMPPGMIPVVTPEAKLRLNYTTIKMLGLSATESLLSLASEIIHE